MSRSKCEKEVWKWIDVLISAGPDEEGDEGQDPEGDVERDEHPDVKRYVVLLESEILDDHLSVGIVRQWREVGGFVQAVGCAVVSAADALPLVDHHDLVSVPEPAPVLVPHQPVRQFAARFRRSFLHQFHLERIPVGLLSSYSI